MWVREGEGRTNDTCEADEELVERGGTFPYCHSECFHVEFEEDACVRRVSELETVEREGGGTGDALAVLDYSGGVCHCVLWSSQRSAVSGTSCEGAAYLRSLDFSSGSINVCRWDDTEEVLEDRERYTDCKSCIRAQTKGDFPEEGDSRDSVMVYVISSGCAIAGK